MWNVCLWHNISCWILVSIYSPELLDWHWGNNWSQVREYLWWRHQMETFSALLALCVGNSPVTGEFPIQRPVTRSFDVFFDLHLTKQLRKQSWGWWFVTLSRPLRRHSNVIKSVTTRTKNQEQSDTNFAANSRAGGCHNDNLPCIKLWEPNDKTQHSAYITFTWSHSGPSLNIKTIFPGMVISIIKIRRSRYRLKLYHIGNPILVRRHLYIETVPRNRTISFNRTINVTKSRFCLYSFNFRIECDHLYFELSFITNNISPRPVCDK